MAQFDVHALANNKSQLVVNLQHVLFEARPSRLIVPLIPGEREFLYRLRPVVEFDGLKYTVATLELTTLRKVSLGPVLGNLEFYRKEIIEAFDFLVLGF
jgi:hypothetical protein